MLLEKRSQLPPRFRSIAGQIGRFPRSIQRLPREFSLRLALEHCVELRSGVLVAFELHQAFAVVKAHLGGPCIVWRRRQQLGKVVAGRLPLALGVVFGRGAKQVVDFVRARRNR